MTKTWTLQEAQHHLPELIKQAAGEPQVITTGEQTVVVTLQKPPISAWEAIVGDFDFSDMGNEDLFERIKSDDRDIDL